MKTAYVSFALRFEAGEIRWGDPTCRSCKGRGWLFQLDYQNGTQYMAAGACSCAPVETEEDQDRLDERLFMLAHLGDMEGELEAEDAEIFESYDEDGDYTLDN
jgi:hypothetical protein